MAGKPKCKMVGQDGNVFNLMGLAARALKKAGKVAEAKEMVDRCMEADSYARAIGVMSDYVEIR